MDSLKRIYLMRHCSAGGQHKDSPLTTEGIRQAQLLAKYFYNLQIPIDKIISSPYLRAIESMKPFAQEKGIKIDIDDRLKERILSEDPVDDWLEILEYSFINYDFKLPGGESSTDAFLRAHQVLEMFYNHDNYSNMIVITHGNILALLLNHYLQSFGFNEWKELRNPDLFVINYSNRVQSIEHLNYQNTSVKNIL